MMQRGSVVRVRLDPTEGNEQAGTRPALVVSVTALNEKSPLLLVAPITSKKTDRVFRFEALLNHDACGLELPSKAMLNHTRAVSKDRVLRTYGIVDEKTMETVDEALRVVFGL